MSKKQKYPKALHDRVIVETDAPERISAGGIIIPNGSEDKVKRGTIVSVGPGRKDEPATVKVGQIANFGEYAGTEIEFEGRPYLVMRESDILFID